MRALVMVKVAVQLVVCGQLVAGCGGKSPPPADPEPVVAADAPPARTELERRRDAACDQLGPKLTACAVDDAKKTMSAEELAKLELDKTGPAHTRKFVEDCQSQQLSSRQVRVYEVCLKEETACE